MPLCTHPATQDPQHMAFVEGQLRESKSNPGCVVTCRCGHKAPLRFMFRCFYCLEIMCHPCAEYHFGASREEYYQDPLAKWKLTFEPAA